MGDELKTRTPTSPVRVRKDQMEVILRIAAALDRTPADTLRIIINAGLPQIEATIPEERRFRKASAV